MRSHFVIILVSVAVALSACGKKTDTTPTNTNTNTNGGNNSGNSGTCTAQLADAENMAIFPADNAWNLDVSNAATDANSTQIIAGFSTSKLKADFGAGLYDNATIGIPYSVVCGSQAKVPVTFRANSYDGNYGNESDPGPYPIPANAPIEGNGQGDSHVIVVDKENKLLYELYNASYTNGQWQASCGAIFDLASNKLRTDGWTSADAAGLPIFPGLVRYEEVLKGTIDHAIRFTLQSANVKPAYVAPARHSVNSKGGQYSLPFGAKIRLKASFDISGYSATNKVILIAMKKYGLILADIGSNMYITGAPDDRWNNDDLQKLGGIAASNFEVVKF
ncbi:hypothetical protein [Mucilaginibacter sp. UYCu711]|uniref:hypothetical protein n=1 Tax=Mucilaginibacter sp. UYCu711 TaxID=3156339 RepID=UPI003D229D5C